VSVEPLWNEVARHLKVTRVIGDAAFLPFRSAAFDALVFLETLEHLEDRKSVSQEMSRVARPDAILLLTTPARWRYAFAGDPHFAIRGLVLLPARWQRRVAARRGFNRPEHFVDRIYGSVPQIHRVFPARLVALSHAAAVVLGCDRDAEEMIAHSHSIVLGGLDEMS
jgi:SAM-dependent methyltransferase